MLRARRAGYAKKRTLIDRARKRLNQQNSQNEPGFPRAHGSKDDYNREEEKLPFPMRRKLL